MNKYVIVVEGTSDVNKLKNIIDADFVITNGSAIDEETLQYLETLSKNHQIIVLTDPDFPGEQIRKKISSRINCFHAFVSREKASNGKKLGVAECNIEEIKKALSNYVFLGEDNHSLSREEFLSLGLIGDGSVIKRKIVADYFKIGHVNAKTLFKRLNMLNVTYEEIKEVLCTLHRENS